MADTMKFGPEWLRVLSDGSQPTVPAPTPSSKFRLADYRYGREEMLALFQESCEPALYLKEFPHIFVEETQMPISLLPLSEDEERVMAQGVNSQLVTRAGRGGTSLLRGGRGGVVDRGRGRGRGRGDGYSTRNVMENGDISGGFGRPRGPNKDGWEEVGSRKLDRGYARPFDDAGREGHPRYSRSMSDNWREKGPAAEEEEEADWRKSGSKERWSTRTSWRESGKPGVDSVDRRNGAFTRGGLRDPRESEDVPEWADDGDDDVGTFDSSGAFVSNKEQPYGPNIREEGSPAETGEQTRNGEIVPSETDLSSETKQESHGSSSPPVQLSNNMRTTSLKEREQETVPVSEPRNNVPSATESMPSIDAPATPVLPSMPQGVTFSSIVLDQKTEAKNAAATSMTDENALKWFYTDPQAEVQGPFVAEEMAQWFSAGYFTMNLLVKRGCDQQFQPLGELMKRWGHVPFLPGAPPPPILQSAMTPSDPTPASVPAAVTLQPPAPTPTFSLGQGVGGTDSLLIQQQLLLQHQILQLQMGMRQLQMQTLAQLQEQDTFKTLDPAQQQQLSMQMIQANPLVLQHMQQLQQLQHMQQQTQQQQQQSQEQSQPLPTSIPVQQKLQTSSSGVEVSLSSSTSNFQRSISQPSSSGEGQGDIPSIWGTVPTVHWSGSQPGIVWELEKTQVSQAIKADLDKLRQEKEAELARLLEVERMHQEKIQKQQEELRRQTEALQREREQMEREKEALERQRQMEIQRMEEIRKQKEEEQIRRKLEEEEAELRRQQEIIRRKKLEEQQRKKEEREREEERREEERRRQQEEEEQRKAEEVRKKREAEERALQEMKQQEELRQQQEAERRRQQELDKQQQEEEAASKKQEFQRQQQEALKRLQQQQALQNIQLPSSVNWARQQQSGQSGASRPLTEIQQEEEMKQHQLQLEKQQMLRALTQQQQQQQQLQKSWASNIAAPQPSCNKTLAEIQEEQERQLNQDTRKIQQHHQAKAVTLSQAAVWGSGPVPSSSTPWGGGSVWGSDTSLGLWGTTVPQQTQNLIGKKSNKEVSQSAEFPALRSQKSNKPKQSISKTTQAKPKKEEEAVHRLFKDPAQDKDEFTIWCESYLQGMDVQIDIETFVTFLQAVDSPYEVHDYVKNYLGEGKSAREFVKQFLEKRSHYKNKARNEKRQEEDSIWGPAPALNPRENRGSSHTNSVDYGFTEVGGKSKGGKKKKKMQKLDGSSLLGFTVEKDPNRKNAGEIESLD